MDHQNLSSLHVPLLQKFKILLLAIEAQFLYCFVLASVFIHFKFKLIHQLSLVLECWLTCVREQSLPGTICALNFVGSTQAWNWDHRHIVIDMANSETSESSHSAMNSIGCKDGTHLSIVAVGSHSSDHVGRVNVLESSLQSFFSQIIDYFSLEVSSNILNKS